MYSIQFYIIIEEYVCLWRLVPFVAVTMGTTNDCESAEYVNISSSFGWIASIVSQETGCGSVSHPWVITVQKGQRINVTLYDFSPEKRYRTNQLEYQVDTHVCREYALMQEVSTEWNSVVCGGGRRIQNVYSSKSNSLEIQITNKDQRYFLLYYEGELQLSDYELHYVVIFMFSKSFILFRSVANNADEASPCQIAVQKLDKWKIMKPFLSTSCKQLELSKWKGVCIFFTHFNSFNRCLSSFGNNGMIMILIHFSKVDIINS